MVSSGRCGLCDNFSGRLPLCGTCHAFFSTGAWVVKLGEESMLMLRMAVNGVHRQSKTGRLFDLEHWNALKERRLIRQNPSGYCYTTWFGNELLKRDQQHMDKKIKYLDFIEKNGDLDFGG